MKAPDESDKDRKVLQRIMRAWQVQQLVDEIARGIAEKIPTMTQEEIEAEYQRLVREKRKRQPN